MKDEFYCIEKPKVAITVLLMLLLMALLGYLLILVDLMAGLILGTMFLIGAGIDFICLQTVYGLCLKMVLSEQQVKVFNIFNKILREKKWQDLKEIKISCLVSRYYFSNNYICLIFTDEIIGHVIGLTEVLREKDVIVLKYTEENLNTIKKYTNLPVNTEEMKEIKTKKTSK